MRRLALASWAVATAVLLTLAVVVRAAQATAWEQWQHLPGVADLGVRSDGQLIAMANARLYLVSPTTGAVTPFATTFAGGGAPDAEYYFAIAPSELPVDGTDCAFHPDDLFILDLTSPPGVTSIDASGQSAQRLVTLPSVDTLGGITLDTVGTFGHRLLVTGTRDNKTTLFAIDCIGSVATLTSQAPLVEGGIAVAPPTFGKYGGMLIAPDENSGQLWALDSSGNALLVASPSLPTGGDTGIESVGFVPPGFVASASGHAYLADRGTPNNPFPGTDSILRLSSSALQASGIQDGDLLVSTEGGGTTIAIRCNATCSVLPAAQGTPGGHIEGHVIIQATP